MDLSIPFTPADLMHGRVLSYELRGGMTKSRSSSSASRAAQCFRTALTSLEATTIRLSRYRWITRGQERHGASEDSGAPPCSTVARNCWLSFYQI